ncbi:biotin--[acetyl-CoA-carboxylase] ligase [Actinosynnema sp. NPDC020468]|uniref:biotin--[acetyl-CoA-carboxylase] ligase n=1 Tax=Actinosynnema sp. NPDC020468 TaxID=3154488 RepID=UPI0033E712CE
MTLDAAKLRGRLPGYPRVDVVASTGSTNTDLATAARDGAPDRTALVAGEQTAGQGRRGREWRSPGGGLYVSVLFRPVGVPAGRIPWLTLIAGLALVRTARSVGVEAALKWPNDLLIGDDKAAGVLAEIAAPEAVVVGMGLNVARLPADVRPGPGGLAPTSLAEHAGEVDREDLAVTLLTELDAIESDWRYGHGVVDEVRAEYVRHCATIGAPVRVELAKGAPLLGTAVDVTADGTLLVRDESGNDHVVSAGDVVHLRVR